MFDADEGMNECLRSCQKRKNQKQETAKNKKMDSHIKKQFDSENDMRIKDKKK